MKLRAKPWVSMAIALVAASTRISSATSDVSVVLPGSAATYSHQACQIEPSGQPSCDSDFKLVSGSETGWPCFMARITLERTESAVGECAMSSSGATVHVSSPGCGSFHTATTDGEIFFHDESGHTWGVESFVIKAGGYRHTIGGDDRWRLIPFGPSEPDGSRIVATREGRTMTLVLRGEIWSSSYCSAEPIPVEPSAFGFDLRGRWVAS